MKVNILSDEVMELVREMLNKGRTVELTVSGDSMRPFYQNQKTAITLKSPEDRYKKYDVVLYKDSDKYKLHRIISIRKDRLVIRGDALREKEYIPFSRVFGKVIEYRNNTKIIKSNSKRYKVKVFLWQLAFPLRRVLLRLFNLINKTK